jgi:hypothetical protein
MTSELKAFQIAIDRIMVDAKWAYAAVPFNHTETCAQYAVKALLQAMQNDPCWPDCEITQAALEAARCYYTDRNDNDEERAKKLFKDFIKETWSDHEVDEEAVAPRTARRRPTETPSRARSRRRAAA